MTALHKNIRVEAVNIILAVFKGQQLERALSPFKAHSDYSLLAEICFGSLRFYARLEFIAKQLLQKPLKSKDRDVEVLLIIGLYQLLFLSIKSHAVVNETVNATAGLKKGWAKNLVNALLRRFLREKENLLQLVESNIAAKYAHPQLLIDLLEQQYPQHWQDILVANNHKAPLSLRVNLQKISLDKAQALLKEHGISVCQGPYTNTCLTLEKAMDVKHIPGFEQGFFSVQDQASQLVASILCPEKGDRILDACAAPGGKTCALLESETGIELIALDNSEKRLNKLKENLSRLQLDASIVCMDLQKFADNSEPAQFDKILLDAPCSSLGVIRRHPEIKYLRNGEQIKKSTAQQQILLDKIWPLLKVGGKLLYSTCSILHQENNLQMQHFFKRYRDAKHIRITLSDNVYSDYGWQILPGHENMDGFYYCLIEKMAPS